MMKVNAYAALDAGEKLTSFQFELPKIGSEQVDIKVHYCGVCHSDLSMLNNEWGMTQYPFVPGHEIVGEVVALGNEVKNLKKGDLAGFRVLVCIVTNVWMAVTTSAIHQNKRLLEDMAVLQIM